MEVAVSELKLYAVEVSRGSKPTNHETIRVRTYTARRAQELAVESFPGCHARTRGVFTSGIWQRVAIADR